MLYNLEFMTVRENCQHACDTGLKIPSHLGKFGSEHHRSKDVYQYTMDGEFVAMYHGCHEAERYTGVRNTGISTCALGKVASAGNFKWKYI